MDGSIQDITDFHTTISFEPEIRERRKSSAAVSFQSTRRKSRTSTHAHGRFACLFRLQEALFKLIGKIMGSSGPSEEETYECYDYCRIRRNTPYCESCKAYGHGPGSCPKAQVFAASVKPSRKSKLKCDWCSRPGHSENECFSKKNYLAKHAPGNVIGASQNP